MKRLLVRADDLGYSEGVNYGISKSVKEGIVGSVGVMTNMPAVTHGLKLLENTD
ncbi:ChbG/HpnK family deacetylase, partial [Bacillus cereus]|uniref:ChbG/HpnK family deacetylase n=2 Tax=Bacillaceae TaxID=186817 RepID=UPI00366BFD8F